MQFKLAVLLFGASQILLSCKTVSAYPQTTIVNNNNEGKEQQQFSGSTTDETQPVEFQIQQNSLQGNDPNDICFEPKRIGPCKASIPKYYFNQATSQCERFLYGGCDGSNNRFNSLNDCEQKCSKYVNPRGDVVSVRGVNNEVDPDTICELPHTEGPSCKAYVPRWTYNSSEGKCVQFIYKGCGATKNNFHDKNTCENICRNYKKVGSSSSAGLKNEVNACKLPVVSGPCFAMNPRYYFNQENNRCERFIYGGCGGNENNFKNANDCVRTCGGDEPSHDPSCSEVDCPWNRYSHYTTMGCKPIYDANSCCPTRFDCPDTNLTTNAPEPKCRYQGKLYSLGEMVEEASTQKDCRASCTCVAGFNGKPRIICASIECPEQLGGVSPGKESCRRLYKRGSCCVDNYYCPNATRIDEAGQKGQVGLPPPPPVEPYECQFEGKTYYEGERMYPQKSKCLTCSCQKGFNGTLSEEFCDKVDCGIEIYYSDQLERGCAPVYFQDSNGVDSCCPISWQCPEDTVTTPPVPVLPKSDENIPLPPTSDSQGPITILPYPLPDEKSNEATKIPPNQGSQGPVTILPFPLSNIERNDTVTSSACQLPIEAGPCKAIRPRFAFSSSSKKCESFTYGGCRGNKNNFVALSDCQRVCESSQLQLEAIKDGETVPLTRARSGPIQIQPITYKLTEIDPCEQPVKTGPCRAYFPRYYFSPEENSCKFFVFGGCKGNENNFYSRTSCEAKCENRLPIQSLRSDNSATQEVSSAPAPETGDRTKVTFETNERPTDFKIIDITPPDNICRLPAVTGRCKAHVRRYFFDGAQCKLFTYGGCGGNANNFNDLDQCNQKCASSANTIQPINVNTLQRWRSGPITETPSSQEPILFSGTERCKLPVKTGSCYGRFPSYYYDVISRSCHNFTFSGCFGNTNRFSELEDCKAVCERPLELERTNELTLTSRSGQVQIQPAIEENEEGQIQGRQLLPGEVIVQRPKPQVVQNENPEAFDERVFCALPAEKGPCKGTQLRFFWDSDTKSCLPFFFGGCRGNKNNFLTESDCLSICGGQQTIEQISQDGVLSCSFGNETLSYGSVLRNTASGSRLDGLSNNNEVPCGVPICSCQTPPTLTCIQKACGIPAAASSNQINIRGNDRRPLRCPTPNCRPHCTQAISKETGCPVCDCDPTKSEFDVVTVTFPTTSSSGEGVKG
jgi:hypothetical protein